VLLLRISAHITFLAAVLTARMISDFFYFTAIRVIFFNRYVFVEKIRHIVFMLNFINGEAHIVTNKIFS